MRPKLLIVDDHRGFREFASALLAADGYEVTGEAADGESALEVAALQHPDVVLLDVQLPGIDGFEVAERLAASPDPPRVVLTSSRAASSYGTRLAQAHVAGFIPKQDLSAEALTTALH